ncbi:hypothetical protein [Burkholderia pseudomultivorans]|uniref:hypothetical protein n=1 Tax=Burkholderia pseudomultivorans TaxID=1207504 RepID=UPI0012D897E9|nr:hypothetical protein [Burkholderia pseudomultivorans]
MNYFNVNECGLYRHMNPKPFGLELEETFRLIADWVRGKPLADTIPWNPKLRTSLSKIYCKDVYTHEDNGDILLVLWKSDTDNTGTLLGAEEHAVTGEGKVVTYTNNYRGKKVVWGRPCYYWILPSENLVISIKFDHSVCDTALFQEWTSACITNRVKHPNKTKEKTDSGQIRLSFTDGTQNGLTRFRYGFDVCLKTMDTSAGKLSNLAASVTHIIKRETIEISSEDESTSWVRIFNNLPYMKSQPKATKRQIEIRAEARPTAQQLKEIIEKFAKENRKKGDWDNVGFYTTDKAMVWADRYRLKGEISYEHNSKGPIQAVDLYESLLSRRDEYLTPIRDQDRANAKKKTGT